ncbi:hypothetical protein SAMN05421676_102139 [Salinibacillus kushneri]|uniref:Uncharacterized protein n=1 Tax=Salinibacillus kushneri TaxID=237682 RepID=A0A1I0AFT0_9BACI|nr:hypothetical protein [Salinibacillus kushneri]SES92984.1 hypothetical protein SAMN05421676_102139 [Salinibacillus kushneri]
MPIQNDHEIQKLHEMSEQLENAAQQAVNDANPEEMKRIQKQLRKVQDQIQEARGKAINGNGGSGEPLFDAQMRVEESQHRMERAINNISANQNDVQP